MSLTKHSVKLCCAGYKRKLSYSHPQFPRWGEHDLTFGEHHLLFSQQLARDMRQWQSFLDRGYCPVFRNINVRTQCSFWILFTRCSDDVSL